MNNQGPTGTPRVPSAPVSRVLAEARRQLEGMSELSASYSVLSDAVALHVMGDLSEADLNHLLYGLVKLGAAKHAKQQRDTTEQEVDFERRRTAFLAALDVQYRMMTKANFLQSVASIAKDNGFHVRNSTDGLPGGIGSDTINNADKKRLKRYQTPDIIRFGVIVYPGEVQIYQQIEGDTEGDWILQGLE